MTVHALPQSGGNRYGNRLRLCVPASLVLPQGVRACELIDISLNGACIRLDMILACHRTVLLSFHELRLFSTVAWSNPTSCGLRFDQQLPHEDMQGFLWITQHPEAYERICRQSGVLDWSLGIGH